MPVDRDEWNERIKAVERQYHTARFGIERLRADVQRDPTIARQAPERLHIADARRDLEFTYLVRMFAEFESGLRSFWKVEKPGRKPRTEHLLDGVASTRSIANDLLANAHAVRRYRNNIVHEHDEEMEPIPIVEARKHLMLFFRRLPFRW